MAMELHVATDLASGVYVSREQVPRVVPPVVVGVVGQGSGAPLLSGSRVALGRAPASGSSRRLNGRRPVAVESTVELDYVAELLDHWTT